MKKNGFPLIPVLIFIVVIAILAAIIIPSMMGAARGARERMLKADLQEIRNAIGHFNQECGDYPAQLEDIVAAKAPETGASGKKIDSSKFKGPYLKTDLGELPENPFNKSNLVGVADVRRGDEPVGLIYNPSTGKVHANSGTAMDGTDYSTW